MVLGLWRRNTELGRREHDRVGPWISGAQKAGAAESLEIEAMNERGGSGDAGGGGWCSGLLGKMKRERWWWWWWSWVVKDWWLITTVWNLKEWGGGGVGWVGLQGHFHQPNKPVSSFFYPRWLVQTSESESLFLLFLAGEGGLREAFVFVGVQTRETNHKSTDGAAGLISGSIIQCCGQN